MNFREIPWTRFPDSQRNLPVRPISCIFIKPSNQPVCSFCFPRERGESVGLILEFRFAPKINFDDQDCIHHRTAWDPRNSDTPFLGAVADIQSKRLPDILHSDGTVFASGGQDSGSVNGAIAVMASSPMFQWNTPSRRFFTNTAASPLI